MARAKGHDTHRPVADDQGEATRQSNAEKAATKSRDDLSSYPHWDGTEKVALADLDTAVLKNVVGGGEMKVEVW
jgi:hypothetical protein